MADANGVQERAGPSLNDQIVRQIEVKSSQKKSQPFSRWGRYDLFYWQTFGFIFKFVVIAIIHI